MSATLAGLCQAARYTPPMSKVDAQRAMREARFAALQAQAKARAQGQPPAQGKAATPGPVAPSQVSRTRTAADEPAPMTETDDLCGHRSIGNKRCQRPKGHAEKNHRYS